MTDKIMIVEDDADIADLIRVNLLELGADITHHKDGQAALDDATVQDFDLMILDVMLPSLSGLDICRMVRQAKPTQAIIMLTAKNSETDRVLGLELGADDYMTKPFSVRELQARVRSQLRKVKAVQNIQESQQKSDVCDSHLAISELTIDHKTHHASLHGCSLELTVTEFELLAFMAKYP